MDVEAGRFQRARALAKAMREEELDCGAVVHVQPVRQLVLYVFKAGHLRTHERQQGVGN